MSPPPRPEPTEAEAAALAAIGDADTAVETANTHAHEIQREAGDTRARAIARLVDVAGRERAAVLLGVSKQAVDKATGRARALGGAP